MDKTVLYNLSYGLYAIGVNDNGRKCGCIVNTVFQVTSTDPIIAVSMNKDNYTYEVIKRTNQFSVSILSEQINPNVIAALGFASGRDTDKFDGIGAGMIHDLPILSENCCGYMICGVVSMLETSTHFVILAKVRDAFGSSALPPMTYKYYHDVIKGKAPKNAPTYVAEEKKGVYRCPVCGYLYEGDITKEPDSYVCPICGAPKESFVLI